MDGPEALASLGLRPGADWIEIKQAYRAQIRSHHPDLSDEPDVEATAALIIEAYATLAELDRLGCLPEPPVPPDRDAPAEPAPNAESAVLVVPPGALFDRLLDAAHDVGDVTYVDPESATVQLLVGLPGWPPSQLTCQLGRRGNDDVIISTLDSMDARPAPPIESVVELLRGQLRSR